MQRTSRSTLTFNVNPNQLDSDSLEGRGYADNVNSIRRTPLRSNESMPIPRPGVESPLEHGPTISKAVPSVSVSMSNSRAVNAARQHDSDSLKVPMAGL